VDGNSLQRAATILILLDASESEAVVNNHARQIAFAEIILRLITISSEQGLFAPLLGPGPYTVLVDGYLVGTGTRP
jgi:uncharacterized surface protein with fasciclin (FAS1) repeats